MRIKQWNILIILLLFTSFAACKHEVYTPPASPEPPGPTAGCDPDTVYFSKDILPLLNSSCAKSGCHDATSHTEGVILTDYTSIINTGEIIALYPEASKLYEMITENDPDKIMPPSPNAPLTSEQIALIRKWIMQGAKNNSCTETVCDTVNVTYQTTIGPIFTSNCAGCHNDITTNAGINLSTYDHVVAAVNGGRLLGAIEHLQGYTPMPQGGGKLSACNISQIKIWINNGKPTN